MPIPTCECSICHQIVNKSTTYHIGNGKRACKSHQGIVKQAQAIQDKTKADKQAEEEKKERQKLERWKNSPANPQFMDNVRKWGQETCWICRKTALPLQSYYNRMLIALEKGKIRGDNAAMKGMLGLDAQSFEQARKDLGFPIGTIFYRVLSLDAMRADIQERVLRDIKGGIEKREVAEFAGVVHICRDCCIKHELEFDPPPPSSKTVIALAMLGSIRNPLIENIAKKELEVDKFKDNVANVPVGETCPHCVDPKNETKSPDCPYCNPK
jgi:hypothetical protein